MAQKLLFLYDQIAKSRTLLMGRCYEMAEQVLFPLGLDRFFASKKGCYE